MKPETIALVFNAVTYFIGCIGGVAVLMGLWMQGQPVDTPYREYWHQKKAEVTLHVAVAVLGIGVWVDGTLSRWLSIDSPVTWTVSLVAGACAVVFARLILTGIEVILKARTPKP